jgi:hypothetical protein
MYVMSNGQVTIVNGIEASAEQAEAVDVQGRMLSAGR